MKTLGVCNLIKEYVKIYSIALISYFLVHNESVCESIPRVIYTKVSRIKCSPLLHKNVYSVLGMETSHFLGLGFVDLCCLKMKGSSCFIAPLFLGLIVQPRRFSLLDPGCYSDGFFQRWLFSKLKQEHTQTHSKDDAKGIVYARSGISLWHLGLRYYYWSNQWERKNKFLQRSVMPFLYLGFW